MANTILLALAPIFFVLMLGYGAGRLRVVDNVHVDSLNTLVMTFALPASLFAATATASREQLIGQVPLFVIFSAVMLLMFAAWYGLQSRFRGTSRADASLQALTVAFPNMAGVGLPILTDVLGPAGTVPVAVALTAGSIITSPLSLILVELDRKDGGAQKPLGAQMLAALGHALTKPVVLAPAFGILVSFCELKTGRVFDACLQLIGQAGPGAALFLTGLILSAHPFRLDRKVVSASLLGDVVRPLLTVAIVCALPVSAEIARVVILISAMPSGFFGILFAVEYRLDSATMGSIVAASTVLSVVTMAIAIAVLFPR